MNQNIKNFIKAKEEEFDEKFPPARDGDYTKHPLPHIKHFLSQSLLEYNEKIKEMVRDKKYLREISEKDKMINDTLDNIITNLTQDTNPKE